MLRYTEFGISHMEVPGEDNLCIYISGCQNQCKNCHYPELKSPDEGELLADYFTDIIDLYDRLSSCVCFLGEGDLSEQSKEELIFYAKYIKSRGKKCCLYSGRDVEVEEWMKVFDFVKTGSYKEEFGPLHKKTTNQRFYRITDIGLEDITKEFWE